MCDIKRNCSPAYSKSFNERNPDLDINAITSNPNVPTDVKAVLCGNSVAADDNSIANLCEDEGGNDIIPDVIDTDNNSLDMYSSDLDEFEEDEEKNGKKKRRKKSDEEYDDDWFERHVKKKTPKKSTGKRGRPRKNPLPDDGAIPNVSSESKTKKKTASHNKKKCDSQNSTELKINEIASDDISQPSSSSSKDSRKHKVKKEIPSVNMGKINDAHLQNSNGLNALIAETMASGSGINQSTATTSYDSMNLDWKNDYLGAYNSFLGTCQNRPLNNFTIPRISKGSPPTI